MTNQGDVALKLFQLGLEGQFVLTSGGTSVYNGGSAVVAARRLTPLKDVVMDWELTYEKPLEARNAFPGVFQHIHHLTKAKGKVPSQVYCDELLYYFRMGVSGVPTVATLPTAAQTLLAASAIAATMPALTTQPNATADSALSKIIAVTLANVASQTTAVNVTINGTDIRSNALTEIVNFPNGTNTPSKVGGGTGATTVTLYSKNYFRTVTSITTSAQPASDTLAFAGVNAFLWTFTGDMASSTLFTATGEYFDGAAAWQLPGMILSKFSLTADIGKSFKLDADLEAQNKVAMTAGAGSIGGGGATTGTYQALTNLTDNQLTASDTAMTRVYADPIGAVPGTTLLPARLTTYKLDIDTKLSLGKAADGTALPTFVSRGFTGDSTKATFSMLLNSGVPGTEDPATLTNFLNFQSRTVRLAFPGVQLPCGALNAAGNWPVSLQDASNHGGLYGVMFDMPGKLTKASEKAVMERTALDFDLESEVDPVTLASNLVITIVSRLNPNL